VWAVVVEVCHVLDQHCGEMAAVDDQDPVEQFPAGSSDRWFGDGVGLGCPYRGARNTDALAGEHGIEHAGELAVAVPDQNPDLGCAVAEVVIKLRACCATQARRGWAVTPRR